MRLLCLSSGILATCPLLVGSPILRPALSQRLLKIDCTSSETLKNVSF